MTSSLLVATPKNSTIVRSSFAQRAARGGFQLLDRLAPTAAARLAQRLFFTPPRAPLGDQDRRILESGRRGRVDFADGHLAVWRWGEGPRVLLVHGWGGHAGQMTAFIEPLLAAGHEVVLVDLPGHGLSSGERASIVHFADAIERVVATLGGIDTLIAHSLGTAGATLAIARGLAVRRAVYFAPPARLDAVWARFRDGLGMSEPAWLRFRRGAERWLGLSFNDVVPAQLAPQLAVPLLIIRGDRDREIPLAEGEALQALWPQARLQRAEGLGHLRVLRDAETVRAATQFVTLAAPQRRSAVAPEGGVRP